VKQKIVLMVSAAGLAYLSIIVISMISAISVVRVQQQYEFVTKWGSEGSGPGQFSGQNDVDPFMVRICCRL
jgi:hypothetical protein